MTTQTTPQRHGSATALRVYLALSCLPWLCTRTGSAQVGPVTPIAPRLLVEFKLTLIPDSDAVKAGAVALTDRAYMDGLWLDTFTGSGCIGGLFEYGRVRLHEIDGEASAKGFEVVRRYQSESDVTSRIEWEGKLEGGKISGDVWISSPGTPMSPDALEGKRIHDRELAKKERAIYLKGELMNLNDVKAAGDAADRSNEMLAMQGRRLHFTFKTESISLIPIGDWDWMPKSTTQPARSKPATRPTTSEKISGPG